MGSLFTKNTNNELPPPKQKTLSNEDDPPMLTNYQYTKRDEYIPQGKPVETALGDAFRSGVNK